jgi:DNA-binding NarL/FixJ family response regulator
MKRPRVLLADDHAMVAQGLEKILKSEFDLVGTVGDGRELVASAEKLTPDVIIADISMPSLNGLEAVRQLKEAENRAKVIFLTMHADADLATEAFRAGASGYVLKHSAAEELIESIRQVLAGRVYVAPSIEGEVLEAFMRGGGKPEKAMMDLSPRQREILQLVAEGRTMREIASQLNISIRTVESHKYDMMEKLGLKSTAEVIQFAIKRGIVAP